jgi:two-component sensor histidine kinase
MYRLDIPSRLHARAPRWMIEVACGVASVATIALARRLIDTVLPGVAPFALLYPGVLMATVLAGWRAGLMALLLAEFLIWRHLLSPAGFDIQHSADLATLVLNTASGLVVIAVAETGRLASRLALEERGAKLETRELLFRELDHRVKNTFAMIKSLIDLQQRRATEPSAQAALGELSQRIEYIGRAHNFLYLHSEEVRQIDLCAYLDDVSKNLDQSLFSDGRVRLEFKGERVSIDRDRAVALGLLVHELVMNAAKHAFGDRGGVIHISLQRHDAQWRLSVSDDGKGLPADFDGRSGLGRRLIEAFAKQAGGALVIERAKGASFRVDFKA